MTKLDKLRDQVGDSVLTGLRDGTLELNRWQGTSPHNWFIMRADGKGRTRWHESSWVCELDLSMFDSMAGSEYMHTRYRLKNRYRTNR